MGKTDSFGQMIRELRLSQGLSLRELASRSGVHYSYISKLENDKLPAPSYDLLGSLADALGVPRAKLISAARRVPREVENRFKQEKSAEFSATLKDMRQRKGLTQAELSALTGINYTYISKMEAGKVPPPSSKAIARLANALEITPEQLLKTAGKSQRYQEIMAFRSHMSTSRRTSMTSIIKSPLSLGRLALALLLVAIFSVAIWSASPTPVKAVDITTPSLPNGTAGLNHTFTVQITVENTDVLPIQAVSIFVQSMTNPTVYNITFAGLLVPQTPSTAVGPLSINGASITGASDASWGGGTSGSRIGYGTIGGSTGYATGTGFGYGYGSAPNTGHTATLTYTVTWIPPIGWPSADTYQVIVLAYGTAGNPATAFTQATASTFSLAASPTGVGGGGGGVIPAPGTTSLVGSISPAGVTMVPIIAHSDDNKVTLNIPTGTVATQANGLALSAITITTTNPPAPPADSNILGLSYNFGPSGAKFNPAVTITLPIPAGLTAAEIADLTIAFYDTATGTWVELTNVTVDAASGTISGSTTHFTVFAVLQPLPPVVTVTPTGTPAPTQTTTTTATTTTPAPTQTSTTPPVTTTTIVIPAPSATSTVILVGGGATGTTTPTTNWLWPIIIGVIGVIAMVFVVRYGWNIRRD